MPYGIIKVDTVTFTDNGVDKNISLSGLVQNPTFTGNVTATGTISGDIIRGGTTISGITVTGTTANFVSGVFTTQLSGVTITGTTAATTTGTFISLTGTTATFTSGIIASGTAALPSLAILSDPNTGIFSPGADQLAVATNGTQRITIDSSGRLLAGTATARSNFDNDTTAPALQVEGATGSTSSLAIVRNTASDLPALLYLGKSRGASIGSNTVVQSGDNVGGITFQGNDGSEFVSLATIQGAVDGTPGANDMPGRLVFSTTADGGSSPSERLRITSAGLVGIGTSAPTSTLHIQHAAQTTNYWEGKGLLIHEDATANQGIALYSRGDTEQYIASLIDNAASYLIIGTRKSSSVNGVDAITIRGDGKVGIGTTSPHQLLQINSTSVDARLHITNSVTGSTNSDGFQMQVNNSDVFFHNLENGNLIFQSNSTERFRVDTSGRLLVGTVTQVGNVNGGILQLGSGITFPATAVAATDVNTLDDYEEGTFTPSVVYSTTNTPTYTGQVGRYTKIGRIVQVQIYLNWNESGSVGNLSFAGLPFTVASSIVSRAVLSIMSFGLVGTTVSLTGVVSENSTNMAVYLNDNLGTVPTNANTDGDQDLYVTVAYVAA